MENTDFYRNMLENIYEGVYFVDHTRKITFWNKGAERISGFTAEEVVGTCCYNNILNHVDEKGNKLCMAGCPLHLTILDGETREAMVYLHHKSGHRVPIMVKAIVMEEEGKVIGAVEIFTDLSEKREVLRSMEEYKQLAMKDQLTGVANRRYIDTFIDSKLFEQRGLGITFGVLFLDIDRFKVFNDTYGHDIGDEVLTMVAKTCEGATRSTDLFGRFGGEEFVAVLVGITPEVLEKKAEQIRMLIESSALRINDMNLCVTVSIGATMAMEEDTEQILLKRADELLYRSKVEGRNRVTIG